MPCATQRWVCGISRSKRGSGCCPSALATGTSPSPLTGLRGCVAAWFCVEAAIAYAREGVGKGHRKLRSKRVRTAGAAMRVRLVLTKRDRRLLTRRHKLRVRVTAVLKDAAGNRASATRTFTLRAAKRRR